MKRRAVESKTFTSLGYDGDRAEMEAEFRSGDIYRYFRFPAALWRRFEAASSKGKFFAACIRDRFRYRKL